MGRLGVSYLQFLVDTKQQILLTPFLSRYLQGPFNKPGSAVNIRYPTVGREKKETDTKVTLTMLIFQLQTLSDIHNGVIYKIHQRVIVR